MSARRATRIAAIAATIWLGFNATVLAVLVHRFWDEESV